MNTDITKLPQYADPAHTGYLEKIKGDLHDRVKLDAKHHGEQNKPNTEPEFRALILNLIQTTIQSGIDKTQEIFLPVSGIVVSRQILAEAQKKTDKLDVTHRDLEHRQTALHKRVDAVKPDLMHIRNRKIVMLVMIVIAVMDGYLSYAGFRFASLPLAGALLASFGVAAAIYYGAHYLGKYIAKATTAWQKRIRWLISLAPYACGFYYLAVLRAGAYNHVTHYATTATPTISNHVTATSIAALSFLLYWLSLYLSTHFYKSDEERKREQDYTELCKEIAEVDGLIRDNREECVSIQQKAHAEANLALATYEYALACECGLKTYAQQMAEEYKTINLRFRTDGTCPEFFARIPDFNIKTFFQNITPKQHEEH